MFYWTEAWVDWLGRWVSVEAFLDLDCARREAERMANALRRPYRVTNEFREEIGRFTGES